MLSVSGEFFLVLLAGSYTGQHLPAFIYLFFFKHLSLFCFFFFSFLRLHLQHMDVPSPEVECELQLVYTTAYTTAPAQQCRI